MHNYIVTIAYEEGHNLDFARTTIEDAICEKDAALIAAAAFLEDTFRCRNLFHRCLAMWRRYKI